MIILIKKKNQAHRYWEQFDIWLRNRLVKIETSSSICWQSILRLKSNSYGYRMDFFFFFLLSWLDLKVLLWCMEGSVYCTNFAVHPEHWSCGGSGSIKKFSLSQWPKQLEFQMNRSRAAKRNIIRAIQVLSLTVQYS